MLAVFDQEGLVLLFYHSACL